MTRRFQLRDFTPADLPAFAAYRKDPRWLEFYGSEESSPDHAEKLLQLFMAWTAEQPRRNFQVAVVRRDMEETLIGCCGLRTKDAAPGKAELGIELAPACWGRFAYAVEIMSSLVDFGFAELGLTEIYGSTVSANTRITRLAAAFGALAVERPAPAWMQAKGWRRLEWQIRQDQWQQSHFGTRGAGIARAVAP